MKILIVGSKDINKVALEAAILSAKEAHFVDVFNMIDQRTSFNENLFEVPEIIRERKQHETYGWYRKFEKKINRQRK